MRKSIDALHACVIFAIGTLASLRRQERGYRCGCKFAMSDYHESSVRANIVNKLSCLSIPVNNCYNTFSFLIPSVGAMENGRLALS